LELRLALQRQAQAFRAQAAWQGEAQVFPPEVPMIWRPLAQAFPAQVA
jgi:hypothetical protein